jgi:Cu/Ag efflux pump CusA
MRRPALYATMIIALAVVPVFFIPGSAGSFVAPLVVAYLVALASAMLVALLVIPVLVSLLAVTGDVEYRDMEAMRWLQRGYGRLGHRAVARGRVVLMAVLVVVAVGAATLPFLSISLMPTLREPDLLITFDGSAGVSRPEMSRIAAAATAELRALPGVSQVGAHVGRGMQSDQIGDVDAAEIWVRINRAADHDATVAAVEEVVSGYPGLRRDVRTYLADRSGSVLSSPGSEVRVRLYGEDSAVLTAKADEVRQLLTSVDGLRDATVQQMPLRPTLQVQVDLAKAQQFNVKPGDVRRTVATLVAGLEVGSLFENQKVFEVVVWGTPDLRGSITGLQNLLVDRPDGAGQVRVGDVAEVRVAPSPAVIQRDSSSRFLDVTAAVSGRGYSAVAADVQERLRAVSFPFEHRAELISDYAERQDAIWRIVGIGVLALVLIYLLLQAAMGSWWLAFVVMVTLPAALTGGAVAVLLSDRVVSLGTLAGLLTVAAISLKQTLGLVGRYQELRARGEPPGSGLVRRGTAEQIGLIVTSNAAVALAVVPMVIMGPIAGLEFLHPAAVAVLGGMVSTTLLNLFVIPGSYAARSGPAQEDLQFSPAVPAAGDGRADGRAGELVGSGSRS